MAASSALRKDDVVPLNKAEQALALTTGDYADLASFRQALRSFLRFSEDAAARKGLTSQQYQALLVLRGWPDDQPVSIGDLARHLLIKHNSAVGLVDRLVADGLVGRVPSEVDRRRVELRLLPAGRRVLASLARIHREELRRIGPFMGQFFSELGRDVGDRC